MHKRNIYQRLKQQRDEDPFANFDDQIADATIPTSFASSTNKSKAGLTQGR